MRATSTHRTRAACTVLAALLVYATALDALAGSAVEAPKPAAAPGAPVAPGAAAQAAAPPPQQGVAMPDSAKITLMIQLHVAALALANITGNYSVFRDLGTPGFQAANTLPALAQRFAEFRTKGIDISPALVYPPVLVGTPVMEANNVMRVTGFYATEPQRIGFVLAFQPVGGMWRLADIQVRTLVPEPEPAPVAEAKSAPADKSKTKSAKSSETKTSEAKPAASVKK